MQQPAKINYKIYQGSTFSELFRWESETKVYVPISSISKSAPCVVTTVDNPQLPAGWRFRVTGVSGMKEINSGIDSYYTATDVNANTKAITINAVNSLQYSNYTSGGVVEFNQPVDLSSYSGRMQIRETVDSTTILHEATTTNNQIVLNNTYKTIEINLPASVTQAFTFTTAVYSLELFTSQDNLVVPFLIGNLTLVPEVTR